MATLLSGVSAFIAGEAVLLSHATSPVAGPFYSHWIDEVNAAMTALGGGYQLTEIDLSSFAFYGA